MRLEKINSSLFKKDFLKTCIERVKVKINKIKSDFTCYYFSWKTIKPKNLSKPLYLHINLKLENTYYPSSINSSIVYSNVDYCQINLNDYINESFTVILSPKYLES